MLVSRGLLRRSVKPMTARLLAGVSMVALGVALNAALGAGEASAQSFCFNSTILNVGTPTGVGSFTCGPNSVANGPVATAIGDTAHAGTLTTPAPGATATGFDSQATGNGSSAYGGAAYNATTATVVQPGAVASGNGASAFGGAFTGPVPNATDSAPGALASRDGSTAIGGAYSNTGNLIRGARATGIGATSIGSGSQAMGAYSVALGSADPGHVNSTAAAFGPAGTKGVGVQAVNQNDIAIGTNAYANSAVFGPTSVTPDIAMGLNSTSIGTNSVAIGTNSLALGVNATALGNSATAAGINSTALGNNATALGVDATALGNASAAGNNSTAIGNGAVAARNNQVTVGTATNTYTTPGITSAASLAAQSGPLDVVTSDAHGNLATDHGQIFNNLNSLNSKVKDLGAGIAVASSLATPDRTGNQTWALAVNYADYEGFNAVSASAIASIAHNVFSPGDMISVAGSVGGSVEQRQVAGRVSLQIAGGGAYAPLPLK
jgi:hypothetical protein